MSASSVKHDTQWIVWYKSYGILLIVVGHCGLDLREYVIPNNLAQLGVGPFFFLLGYNLAMSRKTGYSLIFSRLGGLYFWGFIAAALQAFLEYFIKGNFVESNFLPFIAGINCFFVNASVPGNPVLWFVGAYTHFVIFFVLLRRHLLRVNPLLIAAAFVCEVALRFGDHIVYDSYTFFLSWSGIFLSGIYFQKHESTILNAINTFGSRIYLIVVPLTPIALYLFNRTFHPAIAEGSRFFYVTMILLFASFHRDSNRIVTMVGSNTLIIFLFHHIVVHYLPPGVPLYVIFAESFCLLISLAIVSEIIQKFDFEDRIQEWLVNRWRAYLRKEGNPL